jgi:hypothetical protein
MIDFILSKFGILIFAVTMAGLLIYFASNVKDVFLSDETVQISNIIAKQIKYMAESDNLCASTKVILPRYIDIFGVSENATYSSVYYLLDINAVPANDGDNYFVIFSIINKQTKKQIALESFMTNSDIILYTGNAVGNNLSIDPTDPVKGSVVYMVKGKSYVDEKEKTNIFFINCKYDTSIAGTNIDPYHDCYDQLAKINTLPEFQEYPFFCVPKNSTSDGRLT